MPEGDAELMRRAATGDVQAFAAMYDRHASAALALLRRMLGLGSEAQDLLHDVFLEAWQDIREYDPTRGSARTWLLVRARSRALDRLQRRAREQRSRSAWLAPPQAPAHAAAERTDQRVALRAALAALDVHVRATLELTYFEGLTADEIAAHMQVPAGTVKSRLARGLSQLAALFREVADTEDEP